MLVGRNRSANRDPPMRERIRGQQPRLVAAGRRPKRPPAAVIQREQHTGLWRLRLPTITSAVAGLHNKLGIPHFSTHDLRRTAADHMADIGVNQLIIGWVLNHRSVTRATVTSRVTCRGVTSGRCAKHLKLGPTGFEALSIWAARAPKPAPRSASSS
jgi:integrase